MARPIKKGLTYFPLDTTFLNDRKIQRLLSEHGCEGVTVFTAVLCEIYSTNGYYTLSTEELFFDLSFTLRIDQEKVQQIISFCVQIRLFDKQLYSEKNILTSYGIQQRFEAIAKRNQKQIHPAYRITNEPEVFVTETTVITTETPVIVTETPVIVAKTPTNINTNKKEIKRENKIQIKTNKKQTSKTTTTYGNQSENENTESARRAQLLQMAAEATANKRNA